MKPIVVAEFRAVDSTGGGPDKTIFFSAARHDPNKVRVVPFYLARDDDPIPGIAAHAARSGVPLVRVSDQGKFDPRLPGVMEQLLREHGCDILHTHDFKTDFWGYWIARRMPSLRLMATAHGWSRPESLKHRGYNALDFKVLSRYPRVLAVSEHTAGRLIRGGTPKQRIIVVPNAVDVDDWQPNPASARPADLPPGRLIGTVGRLSPDKDVETLIDAFAVLAMTAPDLQLILVGDGPLREELRARAARWEIGGRVHFLGHRDDLREIYPHLEVFVLSSKTEGLPNTLLEAMAMARPIVATPVGGVAEVARHEQEALHVDPGVPAQLVTQVSKLLTDKALGSRLASQARRRVEGEFSFSARVTRMEAIYADVLGV